MLALDFNARYYDRELMNLAAKESGFSEKFFEQNDEKKGFFKGLFNVQTPHFSGGSMYKTNFSQESLFQFQSDAIIKAAKEGSCVFVGRCADYVLREFGNTVNVFITASMEYRIRQVMNKQHVDADAARKIIEQGESKRAAYYNYYTERNGEQQRAMTSASTLHCLASWRRRKSLPSLYANGLSYEEDRNLKRHS